MSPPCSSSGLTPPTTPPHKPVEDELFKPAEGGKGGAGTTGGSSNDGGGGSESVHPPSIAIATKGSSWLSRGHHQRKLPEQTELYAQLRRMGQAGDSDTHRKFGDHDYCALSLGVSRKPSAAMLGAILQAQGGSDGAGTIPPKAAIDQESDGKENGEMLVMSECAEPQEQQTTVVRSPQPSDCQSAAATPPASEEEAERSSASRSPSPILHLCPDSPASKTDCRWDRETMSERGEKRCVAYGAAYGKPTLSQHSQISFSLLFCSYKNNAVNLFYCSKIGLI